ncbi:LOW QUALITY PROTEIN: E3 ubiquitin-protein ligase TRIM39-like [Sceloporus undulatus]|uniref:LOW QUALITY PROTEIN: E3 ubiquitin-protein ligase TRIM39-like n=1 Tax=Sceloporus undulatus TaxID=8520 RepID=UPI001C4CDC74|nr:LOW QUALITY PROTEIN: E3 ubiquitin-protein ligase TRIM39-like [Sceloporus undulatus]
MATGGRDPSGNLLEEATCSICLDPFRDPVMIPNCGHNFCRACITQCQQSLCPQCRIPFPPQQLRPNRDLGHLVEAIRQLKLSQPSGEPKEAARRQDSNPDPGRLLLLLCEKHQEAAKLFCLQDKAFLCLVCRESRAHRTHSALPIEEAAQEYQDQIQSLLTTLPKLREEILKARLYKEKEFQKMKSDITSARQRIASTLPKKEAKTLLPLLDTCEANMNIIVQMANDISERNACLTRLISELEKKRLQSSFEFLQDIGDLLSRCEREMGKPKPDMNGIVGYITENLMLVNTKLGQFSGNTSVPTWIKENVVLDPQTAHPRYIVSKDRKSVRWGDSRRDVPYNPKRFEYARCVLGKKGFTSGKHYWIVDVEDGDYWAVGVAQESVDRDGELAFEPDEGIWALARYDDQYKALTSPPTIVDPKYDPVEIQVSLNYDAGTVAFYDENKTRLFIFRSIDFEGEKVFPFFRISDSSTSLRLC